MIIQSGQHIKKLPVCLSHPSFSRLIVSEWMYICEIFESRKAISD